MNLLKYITFHYIKRRESALYQDVLELIRFLNKGLNNVEDGINKKIESEYNI